MIDRIEYHVEHAVDYVQTATQVRFASRSIQIIKSKCGFVFFFSTIAWIKTKYSSGYKEGVKVPIEGETGKKIFYDWYVHYFSKAKLVNIFHV